MSVLALRRVGLTAAALMLAVLSALASASAVLNRENPRVALRLWPANGAAAARVGDQAMLLGYVQRAKRPGSEQTAMRAASALAHRSLKTLALNPVALRTIAISDFDGKAHQTVIIEQAARLSRRDPLTELWLINHAALTNDSRSALIHYDALLRLNTPFRDLAGRTLAHALSEPQFVGSIGALLQTNPPWKSLFFHYALRDPTAWDGFIKLHHILHGAARVPTATSAQFAAALVDGQRMPDAARIAVLAGAAPLERTTGLTDNRFAAGMPFPGNWATVEAQGSAIQPLAGGGAVLSFAAGRSGPLARRLIALAPGVYHARLEIDQASNLDSAGVGESDVWPVAQLVCASAPGSGTGSPILKVGSTCPYQWLSIVLRETPRYDGEIYLQSVTVGHIDQVR